MKKYTADQLHGMRDMTDVELPILSSKQHKIFRRHQRLSFHARDYNRLPFEERERRVNEYYANK